MLSHTYLLGDYQRSSTLAHKDYANRVALSRKENSLLVFSTRGNKDPVGGVKGRGDALNTSVQAITEVRTPTKRRRTLAFAYCGIWEVAVSG